METPRHEKPLNTRQRLGVDNQKQNVQAHYTHTLDLEQGFKAHIFQEYGLDLLGDLKTDGAFHYLGSTDDKKGHKPLRYCVHVDTPCNVYFNDLKRGFHGVWYPKGHEPLNPAEREVRRREIEAHRAKREREAIERHFKRAAWALKLWNSASLADCSYPYLVRKGVGAYCLRLLPVWERRIYHEDGGGFDLVKIEGVLLVPMKDETGKLWNLQMIFPEKILIGDEERDKDFLPGARVNGLFHWIGQRTETVCLAEGYATGATIYEATGYRCFVAFSAGNLPNVALIVRAALPDAKIVICADNDKPDKRGRRAGIEKGEEAAALVGGFLALPPIEGADFNDWAKELGG